MTDQLDDLFTQEEARADEGQWDFEENPEIRGILVGVGYAPGTQYGPYFVLRIKTEEDVTYGIPIWGTVLINQVQDKAPKVGAIIGIRFLGKSTNQAGDRSYKNWMLVTGESDFPAWADHNDRLRRKSNRPSTAESQPRPETGPVEDYF
jgi:hypothetical protein